MRSRSAYNVHSSSGGCAPSVVTSENYVPFHEDMQHMAHRAAAVADVIQQWILTHNAVLRVGCTERRWQDQVARALEEGQAAALAHCKLVTQEGGHELLTAISRLQMLQALQPPANREPRRCAASLRNLMLVQSCFESEHLHNNAAY